MTKYYYRLKEDGTILDYTEIEVIRDEEGNATNVPAFIKELYIETDREIIVLTDGSFAFKDTVDLEAEAKRKAEKEFVEAKQAKLQQVDQWTASKITGGFVSLASGEPVTYDSDKDTQLTMQGIALNVQTPLFAQEYPNGCPVRGYPIGYDVKQVYMLNAEQVMRWCADLSMHIGTCKQRGWKLQAQVNACTTVEELESIVLE